MFLGLASYGQLQVFLYFCFTWLCIKLTENMTEEYILLLCLKRRLYYWEVVSHGAWGWPLHTTAWPGRRWGPALPSALGRGEVLLLSVPSSLWEPAGHILTSQFSPEALRPGTGGAECTYVRGRHPRGWNISFIFLWKPGDREGKNSRAKPMFSSGKRLSSDQLIPLSMFEVCKDCKGLSGASAVARYAKLCWSDLVKKTRLGGLGMGGVYVRPCDTVSTLALRFWTQVQPPWGWLSLLTVAPNPTFGTGNSLLSLWFLSRRKAFFT